VVIEFLGGGRGDKESALPKNPASKKPVVGTFGGNTAIGKGHTVPGLNQIGNTVSPAVVTCDQNRKVAVAIHVNDVIVAQLSSTKRRKFRTNE